VYAKPKAAFDYSPSVVVQGNPVSFTNLSTGSTSYTWNFNDPHSLSDGDSNSINPTHTFQDTGKYCVVLVASSNTCRDTVVHCLEMDQKCNFPDSVPNVFTPNGDGINDQFKVKVLGLAQLNCTLYNRWGMLIYQYNAMAEGWDGHTFAENTAPVGTYYYIFEATCLDGTRKQAQGFVELLR
jgi:gliding motility-associated-like protein